MNVKFAGCCANLAFGKKVEQQKAEQPKAEPRQPKQQHVAADSFVRFSGSCCG